VREVYAVRGRSTLALGGEDVEDEIIGHALLTGGLMFQLHDSFIQPHAPVTVELYGTQGSLQATACGPSETEAELLLRRGDSVRSEPVPAVNAYRASVANFLAAVRGAAPALATGVDELYNLAAVTAVRQSLHEGTAVRCRPVNLNF